jgi:uncharacterized protein YqgC (DUF456 family)
MSANEAKVQDEIERRKIVAAAITQETAGVVKTGWICAVIGWFLPVLGLVGYFGLFLTSLSIAIFSGILIHRGNVMGAVKFAFPAIAGSIVFLLLWMFRVL